MSGTFTVDTTVTFKSIMLVSSSPKLVFGNESKQETNAAGVLKWTIEVAATFAATGNGMREVSELLTLTVTTPGDPAHGIAPGTAIMLDGVKLGHTPAELTPKGNIRGGKIWLIATGLRPAGAQRQRDEKAA